MDILKNKLVPRSAQLHAGEAPSTSLDMTKEMAKELANDVIRYFTQTSNRGPCNSHAKTVRRTVDELSRRHEILFTSMIRRLSITEDLDDTCQSFVRVMDELFIDKHYNWGRVITVYTFAGWLARYCVQNGMFDAVDQIVETSGCYVANKLADWIQQQGGWVCYLRISLGFSISGIYFIIICFFAECCLSLLMPNAF